ncbi:MAG: hypothetical protein FJ087_02815 [Deltaproteobacteria bacterium]|nr:hypothetical protein [Deltaproteobacteria bacterium]
MRSSTGRREFLDDALRLAMAATMAAAMTAAGCGWADGGADAVAPDAPATDVPPFDAPPADLANDPATDDAATDDAATDDAATDDATPPADLPPADLPAGDPGADPGTPPGQDLPPVTPGVPILDRAPGLRFDCTVTRGITDHKPLAWGRAAHPLVTTAAGQAFLARVESSQPNPFEPGALAMRVGTFGADGTLGASVVIPSVPDKVSGMAAIPAGDGFLVAWAQESVLTAMRDATGAPVAAPKTLPLPPGDYSTRPVLAALGDGFALALTTPAGAGRSVRFTRLDAQGAAAGMALAFPIQGDGWGDSHVAIAAGGGRFGLLWMESKGGKSRVFFAAVDAAGAVAVGPVVVSDEKDDGFGGVAGFSQPRLALVPVASGWIAAWTEAREGPDFMSGASSLVRLARLDADGSVADRAPVRPAVVDRDEVEPVLAPFQGVVGLFWSSGTHIYVCAGCVPDHAIHFVLLDPYTLAPASEVRSIPPVAGGLLGLSAAAAGDDLLLTAEIGFHVHQEPGSAALACKAKAGETP